MKGASMTMGYNSLGNAISRMEENKLLNLDLIETLFHQSINKVKSMIKAIIVDDDELCRTVISDLLKEVDGFECIANFGNALRCL